MGLNTTEVIKILCKLADSERLKVTANENSKFSVEEVLRANHLSEQLKAKDNKIIQGKTDAIYCINEEDTPSSTDDNSIITLQCISPARVFVNEEDTPSSTDDNSIITLQSISPARVFGLVFASFQAIFSRTWNYVFGNYQMSVNVRVAPVSSVLRVLPPNDQNTLTLRIRQITERNSITTYDALATQIEQDSSLVRRIILRHLVEYLDEDLFMPVTRGL